MRNILFLFLFISNICNGQCDINNTNSIENTQVIYCDFQNVYITDKQYCDLEGEESFKWIIIHEGQVDTISINSPIITSELHEFNEGGYSVCRMVFHNGVHTSTSSFENFEIINCNAPNNVIDTLGWQNTIATCEVTPIEELCNLVILNNPSENCFTIDIQSNESFESIRYEIHSTNGLVESGIYNNDIYCLKQYGSGLYYFTSYLIYGGVEYLVTAKLLVL